MVQRRDGRLNVDDRDGRMVEYRNRPGKIRSSQRRPQIDAGNRRPDQVLDGSGRPCLDVADRASVAVEASLHARHLPGGKHEHRHVVGIVHVVHEHVAVRPIVAGDVGERGRAEIVVALVRRVGDEVAAAASVAIVSPDMPQVEPVTDFVRCGASEVERRGGRADGAEGGMQDHHAVGARRAARKLRIAEQIPLGRGDARRYPQVEVLVGWPRSDAARGSRLDVVLVGKARRAGMRARDSVGRRAAGIGRGEREFDSRVVGQRLERRGNRRGIGIRPPIVAIQNIDLALGLRIGNVLRRRVVDHVDDDGNDRDAHTPDAALAFLDLVSEIFTGDAPLHVGGAGAQQAFVNRHGAAGPLLGRLRRLRRLRGFR